MGPDTVAETFMTDTYGGGWKASLLSMLHEAGVRLSQGVYPVGERTAEDLTVLYDELYCAVTNVVPHKPPLVGAQGWRADDVVA